MKCAPNQPAHLRMRAIWSLGRGLDRSSVAMFCNVHEHTVLEWIHRFNKRGIDGLLDSARKGAPRKIPKEDFIQQIVPLLEEPGQANELHWTIRKLHGYIRDSLAKEVSYPSLLRYVQIAQGHRLHLTGVMLWKETDAMTEKECFVILAQTGRFTISELCSDFGVSRQTGHKWSAMGAV